MAAKRRVSRRRLLNEAVEEHHLVHGLIRELKKLKPSDERFEAKFNVLGELVKHHCCWQKIALISEFG